MIRTAPDRAAEAAGILAAEGFEARADADGSVKLGVALEEDVARAVRALALRTCPSTRCARRRSSKIFFQSPA